MTDLRVHSVSTWCTYSRNLVIKMDHGEMSYSVGIWMVLANEPVQWGPLV
jgi:hypothetical protein